MAKMVVQQASFLSRFCTNSVAVHNGLVLALAVQQWVGPLMVVAGVESAVPPGDVLQARLALRSRNYSALDMRLQSGR